MPVRRMAGEPEPGGRRSPKQKAASFRRARLGVGCRQAKRCPEDEGQRGSNATGIEQTHERFEAVPIVPLAQPKERA